MARSFSAIARIVLSPWGRRPSNEKFNVLLRAVRTSKRIKYQKQDIPADSEEVEEEEEREERREKKGKMASLREGADLLDMSDAEFMVGRSLCTCSICIGGQSLT